MYAVLFITILIISFTVLAGSVQSIEKRVLPTSSKYCDPYVAGNCRKGDWVAEDIARCKYSKSIAHPLSCDAQNDHYASWVVDVAVGDRCKPLTGYLIRCGERNTRCVCSDYNPYLMLGELNECKCQYWPAVDVGAAHPAFCTAYYTGGPSGVHHWACCNNCNDFDTSCSGKTWHGGSSGVYCNQCGTRTFAAGGREKYFFNCGNCQTQQECAERCNGYDYSGGCWKWVDCFKDCCISFALQPRYKRQDAPMFCGDRRCSGGETPESCPLDCCYQRNPSVCTQGQQCTPECCGSDTCCLPANATGTNGDTTRGNGSGSAVMLHAAIWQIVLPLLAKWITM